MAEVEITCQVCGQSRLVAACARKSVTRCASCQIEHKRQSALERSRQRQAQKAAHREHDPFSGIRAKVDLWRKSPQVVSVSKSTVIQYKRAIRTSSNGLIVAGQEYGVLHFLPSQLPSGEFMAIVKDLSRPGFVTLQAPESYFYPLIQQ